MGFVVFQFQLSFAPGAKSEAAVLECRRRLDPRITMAVVRALPLARRAPPPLVLSGHVASLTPC